MSESDSIILTCPACGGRMKAPRASVGGTVGCPSCQADVTVKDSAAFVPMAGFEDPRRKLGQAPARGQAPAADDFTFRDRLHRTSEEGFKVDPSNPVMKRRDLRKQKHGAAMTEWEGLPQAKQKPTRESARQRRERRIKTTLIASSAILAVALAIIFWKRVQDTEAVAAANEIPLELQPVGNFREEVWQTVVKFCGAADVGTLLSVVRDPERVGPLIRGYYSAENPLTPLTVEKKPDLSAIEVHRSFVVFQLPLADYSFRPIALEQTAEGFKVDWESFVVYSELSWSRLRETRPKAPVVLRAVLRPNDYFNRDFPSSTTHRCFQLSDQRGENVLYGYTAVEGPADLQVRKILLNAPTVHAVIKVRYPENSTDERQVEITEVLEKGWIFRDDDLPDLPSDVLPPEAPEAAPSPGSSKPAPLPGLHSP